MAPLPEALLLSLIAGATIPVGGLIASVEHIQPRWLEEEIRHSVIAFGGGALLAAVALVLVPKGAELLAILPATLAFLGGGVVFMFFDRWITTWGGNKSQFMAMLLDFIPEAAALGAMLAGEAATGLLLALLIGLQNLPESFNAFREIKRNNLSARRIVTIFGGVALLGPVAAFLGMQFLAEAQTVLGFLMLFSAGGILYLTFQDIAPQVPLQKHWAPASGAVVGFLVGFIGHMLTQRMG